MKVLFLDHDGVICLASNWGGRFKKVGFDSNPETPLDIRMDNFDVKAVLSLYRKQTVVVLNHFCRLIPRLGTKVLHNTRLNRLTWYSCYLTLNAFMHRERSYTSIENR